MPNRMLRDWTDSDKVNQLTAQAERFFTRLIMKADDHGCFYGDTRLLKSNLFPLLEGLRDTDISRWMAECQKAGLIAVYEAQNKRYLQIIDFRQRLRIKNSRFPLPGQMTDTCLTHDGHVSAECPPEVEVEVEVEENTARAQDLKESNLFRKPVIPTLQQVQEVFYRSGGTMEQAERFFAKHEATGWYLNNSPIRSFASLVPGFIAAWNGKINPDNPKPRIVV